MDIVLFPQNEMIQKLFNGMQFAFKRSNSPVSYCAMSIKTGTRDEDPDYGGMAHFTEHLIFKGTQHRSANSINSYIEKLGGELNAYTTKEETVIHATLLKEDLSKAIDLLVELSFNSIFPEKEFTKERTVVLEEISSYKDSPSDQIFDDFEEYLFSGTSLSMPVLGKERTLKKITRDKLIDYYHSHFIPSNMTFTVVADLDEKKVYQMLMKSLQKHTPATSSPMLLPQREKIQIAKLPFSKIVHRKNHQVHCIIGAPAYSYYLDKRIPLILLINILGGPAANSRLNLLLRERNGLVYGVEASYSQFEETGVVTIYFGCDKDHVDKCISLVHKVLSDFREKLMSERTLNEAKKQLLGQLAISSDNGEAQVLSMGKSIMIFGRTIEAEETRKQIESVTPAQIQEVACEIFASEMLSTLIYK